MSRIRTIKPEFPQSETIGRLSRDARLLFIQLWTIVDDAGRARAASRMLASLLYPYDDDAPKLITRWLDELERVGCIRRYAIEGNTYLEIVKWLEHQKIDRPSPSRLPAFVEGSSNPREDSRALDADLGPSTLDQGPSTLDHSRAVADATRPSLDDDFKKFWEAYPRRDGPNPREPARRKFIAAVRAGTDPQLIIAGTQNFRGECDAKQQTGTPYVAQAMTWLNQKRWADYADPPTAGPPTDLTPEQQADWAKGWRPGMPTSAELKARSATNGHANHGRGSDNPKELLRSGAGVRGGATEGVSQEPPHHH